MQYNQSINKKYFLFLFFSLALNIEDLVKKINKIKALNAKEKLTKKNIDEMEKEENTLKDDRPKIYKHKDFIEEHELLQSAIIAYREKTLTDFEHKKL